MPQTLSDRLAALKDDGFIDFYEFLGVETDATTTRIRSTINTLYNEAQSNRDHRNLNRRREYQTLLQVLPQARDILLDEKNRPLYDAYRESVERGTSTLTFEDWAQSLDTEADSKSSDTSVLGVQEDERLEDGTHVATAKVKKVPPKPISRVVIGDEKSAASSAPARDSLIGTVITIAVFFVLFLVLSAVLKLALPIALLISAVAAVIAWFATHSKKPRRTSL